MNTKKLIKYTIMGFIIVLMVDSLPPKGIGDDTVLFLNPSTSAPPPAVVFLLDDSGSMYDLPCAVPDCTPSCGLNGVNGSNFFVNMGYGVAGSAPNYQSSVYPHYGVFDTCAIDSSCSNSNNNNYTGVPGAFDPNYVYHENGCNSWIKGSAISSLSTTNKNYVKTYGYYTSGGNYYMSGDLLNFYPPKFVVLRKVISDIINYNSNVLLPQGRQVRVAIMDFADNYNSNVLISMNPPCAQIGITNPNDFKLQGDRYKAIYGTTNGDYMQPATNTPLAEALIQLGAYYAQDNTRYRQDACNNSYSSSYCTSYNGGGGTDPWCGNYNGNNWVCEKMYDIVITDGNENSASSGITGWTISTYYNAAKNVSYPGDKDTVCYDAPGGVCHIDEVAGWLHTYNIRNITCSTSLDTYTVGFYGNTSPVSCNTVYSDWQTNLAHRYCVSPSTAKTPCDYSSYSRGVENFWHYDPVSKQAYCQLPFNVLQNAAQQGGGLFASGTNYQQIEDALIKAINNIIQKNRTLGTPSLPSLITEGGGSTSTTTLTFKGFIASFLPKDQNFWIGHLREYTGAGVTTPTGQLQLNLYDTTGNVFTGNTSRFGQCSFSEQVPPPVWDAAADLSDTTLSACNSVLSPFASPCYLAPDQRRIYTVTPALLSGFTTSTTGNGDTIWSNIANPDSPLTSAQRFTTSNTNLAPPDFGLTLTDTATMYNIMNYVIGPKADGISVLGDIYHSDPTLVSVDGLEGLDNFDNPALVASNITALDYQGYLNKVYNMPQIVIAGADDGMIHAFFAGYYTGPTVVGNYAAGTGQFDNGNGQEVWAFIPYDLLPKLQYMYNPALVPTTTTGQYWTTEGIYTTTSTSHVYFVDGSPFIRDVYLPGIDNGLGLAAPAAYWHTIMIIGERLGGTYYICLDISDRLNPKFMWEFTTKDMGFTFAEVSPSPPPIGAVWLNFDPSTGASTAPTLRWVVMLSGGWDPGVTTNRGRAFYVVDIATGKLIWKFDYKNDPNMKYPTPASVGDLGPPPPSNARWWMESILPDLGGQIWQFSLLPRQAGAGTWGGDLDAGSGLVRTCIDPKTDTNCFWGQRIFAAQDPPPAQSLAQQFYYLPSAVWDLCTVSNLWLGVAAGNRDNPLSCSPVNYLYDFIVPNPYTNPSLLTQGNLTFVSNPLIGYNSVACSGDIGWYESLSGFTGTSNGSKSISIPNAGNDVQYLSIFTPDQNACIGTSSSGFSCNALGGTGIVVGITIYPVEGTALRGGQLKSYASTGLGIPSPPLAVTGIFSLGGASSPATTTQTPPNPYSIPVCGGGAGNSSASTQMIVATSEGALKNLGTISSYNLLMYPYFQLCIPQNVEQNYINPLNIWSPHPRQ